MTYALVLATVSVWVAFFTLSPGAGGGAAQPSVSAAGLPDLVIIEMRTEFEAGSDCNWPGHPLGTRVWVRNIGDADADTFIVGLAFGTDSWQQPVSTGLAAGQVTSVWFSTYCYNFQEVTATADVTSVVTESNEGNNSMSTPVAVPTPPPTCTPGPPAGETPSAVGGMVEYTQVLPGEASASHKSSGHDAFLTFAGFATLAGLLLVTGIWSMRRRGMR